MESQKPRSLSRLRQDTEERRAEAGQAAARKKREAELIRESRKDTEDQHEIVGFYWDSGDPRYIQQKLERRPITRGFWRFLHNPAHDKACPDFHAPEQRAQIISTYEAFAQQTEVAEAARDHHMLKLLSDAVRRSLAELPAKIPDSGLELDSTSELEYENTLPAAELKRRLVANLEARGWLQFSTLGGGAQ